MPTIVNRAVSHQLNLRAAPVIGPPTNLIALAKATEKYFAKSIVKSLHIEENLQKYIMFAYLYTVNKICLIFLSQKFLSNSISKKPEAT
jgi:hypothetical protein